MLNDIHPPNFQYDPSHYQGTFGTYTLEFTHMPGARKRKKPDFRRAFLSGWQDSNYIYRLIQIIILNTDY